MNSNTEKLKIIDKIIIETQIFGAPGLVLLGLGLYGMFGASGDAFHPILNNINIVYTLLVSGALIQVWAFMKLIPLWKQKVKIINAKNT